MSTEYSKAQSEARELVNDTVEQALDVLPIDNTSLVDWTYNVNALGHVAGRFVEGLWDGSWNAAFVQIVSERIQKDTGDAGKDAWDRAVRKAMQDFRTPSFDRGVRALLDAHVAKDMGSQRFDHSEAEDILVERWGDNTPGGALLEDIISGYRDTIYEGECESREAANQEDYWRD